MACYKPLYGYRNPLPNAAGKRPVHFSRNGSEQEPITVPCGRCIGCRLERSRQWAIRCMHEASLHEHNAFITLTYANEHLPSGGTLVKSHFQDFMKRLRSYHPHRIRFYHCGEYGEELARPHYHACLFGHDFKDKVFLKKTKTGEVLYTSEELSKAWQYKGMVSTGNVTFQSAAYVARYIMKKISGEAAQEHYETIDFSTGEVSEKLPEYTTMSRKPGIASDWYQKWSSDVFPSDSVIVNGKECLPPRFYIDELEKHDPDMYAAIKAKRVARASKHVQDQTEERLKVREKVKRAQLKQLPRPYEEET